MIRMPAFPVRKYDHSGALLANRARDLQAVFPGVFHASIWNIESLPPGNVQDLRCFSCFASAFSVSAAGPKLSREVHAVSTRVSACFNDLSTPNRAGYVVFSAAISLPAVLPNCSEVWVTSITSYTI